MNPRKWAEKERVDARSFSKKGAATGPLIGECRRGRARPLERARRSLLRNLVEESERSSSSFVPLPPPPQNLNIHVWLYFLASQCTDYSFGTFVQPRLIKQVLILWVRDQLILSAVMSQEQCQTWHKILVVSFRALLLIFTSKG